MSLPVNHSLLPRSLLRGRLVGLLRGGRGIEMEVNCQEKASPRLQPGGAPGESRRRAGFRVEGAHGRSAPPEISAQIVAFPSVLRGAPGLACGTRGRL